MRIAGKERGASSSSNDLQLSADGVRRGMAMDVGAVERIRPVERAGVARGPGDVAPALGVAGATRLQDDSYAKKSGQNEERGMDEDAAEESAEDSEATPRPGSGRGLNLFA